MSKPCPRQLTLDQIANVRANVREYISLHGGVGPDREIIRFAMDLCAYRSRHALLSLLGGTFGRFSLFSPSPTFRLRHIDAFERNCGLPCGATSLPPSEFRAQFLANQTSQVSETCEVFSFPEPDGAVSQQAPGPPLDAPGAPSQRLEAKTSSPLLSAPSSAFAFPNADPAARVATQATTANCAPRGAVRSGEGTSGKTSQVSETCEVFHKERPVKCRGCGEQMYYIGDPRWEPEWHVMLEDPASETDLDETDYYVHRRCFPFPRKETDLGEAEFAKPCAAKRALRYLLAATEALCPAYDTLAEANAALDGLAYAADQVRVLLDLPVPETPPGRRQQTSQVLETCEVCVSEVGL